jgi:iron-sulfur cluster repair protein YtfE (RIC family)
LLINIGPSKDSSDIVDMLLACHERIRAFVSSARRIADATEASAEEIQDAAAAVLRYFSEALPLHVADEEESVIPRLHGKNSELDSALETLRQEHHDHEPQLQELLRLCSILKASPERLPETRESLRRVAAGLESAFLAHLQEEESRVIPAIRSFLTVDDCDAMLAEFRARRKG